MLGDGRRSTVSNRRGRNGRGAGNEGKDVVEVVVIPITTEPRRIGRVRVRAWRHSDDQDRENGTEHAAQAQHAPMIAAMVGQVKERRLAHERRIALKIERFASRKGPKDSLTNAEIHRWIAPWRDLAHGSDATCCSSHTNGDIVERVLFHAKAKDKVSIFPLAVCQGSRRRGGSRASLTLRFLQVRSAPTCSALDQRGQLLRAALGFAVCSMPSFAPLGETDS